MCSSRVAHFDSCLPRPFNPVKPGWIDVARPRRDTCHVPRNLVDRHGYPLSGRYTVACTIMAAADEWTMGEGDFHPRCPGVHREV